MLSFSIAMLGVLFVVLTAAQGPNELYIYNPTDRTMATNGSYFIVPVNRATLQTFLSQSSNNKYKLLQLPVDPTLFPNGFDPTMHPLLVANNYNSDIRMDFPAKSFVSLQIPALISGAITIPYVDALGDGQTPFQYPVLGGELIGGVNGNENAGLIPSFVGSIEGPILTIARFDPDTAAWKDLGGGIYSSSGFAPLLPFPFGLGPSVAPPVYGMIFSNIDPSTALYTSHTFHTVINQPIILPTGMCLRDTQYFNETQANPKMTSGNVTLYAPPLVKGLDGVYTGVGGYSAAGQTVGYFPESCKAAASNLDPSSLQ